MVQPGRFIEGGFESGFPSLGATGD